MSDARPISCFDCVHKPVCKLDAAALGNHFPFKSDHHIGPYLKAITEAQAEACSFFNAREESKS